MWIEKELLKKNSWIKKTTIMNEMIRMYWNSAATATGSNGKILPFSFFFLNKPINKAHHHHIHI